MSDTFHVTFGVARHGWLPVTLATDQTTLQFVASAIPRDPLQDLVACLIVLLTTDGDRCMTWGTEPVEYDWRFTAVGPQATLRLVTYLDQQRTVAAGALVLTLAAPRARLVRTFWRALRRLETQADFAVQ